MSVPKICDTLQGRLSTGGACLFFTVALVALSHCGQCADVVLDRSQTFQTIEGWGNGSGNLGGELDAVARTLDPAVADLVNFQMIDYLADDLGLTGTRIWEIGERPDGQGTDNGDCDVVDWTKFQPGPYADAYGRYMQHFRDRIVAGGAEPSFYSSPFYAAISTNAKPWVLNHPGERAQQIWASALYWRDHYGINMNYAVISNEPGNGNSFTAAILGDDIKALGPRLAANGLSTRIQFPEAINPTGSWTFITALQNDPDVWPYVGRLSYHHYGSADPSRSYIRDFGISKGIPTAQTEMSPATVADLFADLTLGGVTYWEVSYASSYTLVPYPGLTTYAPSGYYFPIRQVTHYVRPGAVRIGATSDPSLNVLAFAKNGAVTVVVWNTAGAQTINVSGLPKGVYGVSQSIVSNSTPFTELGLHTVGADGKLTNLTVGGSAVTTIYPCAGPNHPPTITTWKVNPGRVSPPASTATLSVTANDPELDPLTYSWSVASQPNGANATLATANAATTAVSGLTQAGTYVFSVDVRDGMNTSSKPVYLIVGSNQPPVLGVTGFRFGAPYGYAMDFPGDTPLHTYIALPTPSVVLSANVTDLENDSLTGQWSLVSQPAGASVTLSNQTYMYLSYRATVNNMTVPGDYTFQIDVHDPTHTVTSQVICTLHPANSPPTINSISATPAGVSPAELSADTSDPEGELLRHWWVTRLAPAGAKPAFAHQGLANTTVSNLTVAGSYTFTLRAFDDTHMTTRDVVATVTTPQAANPTFDPIPGTYPGNRTVKIMSTTSGATIRYTTDGSTPSETVGTIYSGPVNIIGTTTLKAIAYKSGIFDSAVSSALYAIQPIRKDRISEVKSMGSGYLVSITSAKVATVSSGIYSDGSIYVSEPDRTVGLKVLNAGTVSLWDNLILTGSTDTESATEETILRATSITKGGITKGANTPLVPLGMSNKTLTSSGQLVKVWGKVTGVTSSLLTLDDGSGLPASVELDGLVAPLGSTPALGDYVSAVGLAGTMAEGRTVIRVRSLSDLKVWGG